MSDGVGLPLSGGFLPHISPNAPQDVQIAAINDVIDRLNNLTKAQIFSDDRTKRFIMGYFKDRWPGGDFGMAISKEGDDVLEADFEDLLFAWDYSTGTQYWYDPQTSRNYMQVGILPDNTGGWAVAAEDNDVADGFS